MVNLPPEKLGSFYLGANYDIDNKEISSESVNYDSRDLTTHAVCVGMTGSGKTGLCVGLLEEAAIDKVPAIIIDPKGDMTNLLLQFEDLKTTDFKKWINPDDASRKGMSVPEYAKATADKWKNGLASWGQDSSRLKKLKESVDYTIYTPGSDSGVPINILGSFASPGINFDEDAEMLHERIQGTVAALLGMIGSKADPVRSREGILLASLFEHFWKKDEDLDLGKIIMGIQNPPFSQLGVFDIETFFPQKNRFDLAMSFNSLIASPQFRYWMQGDDLDIEKIYFTKEGKPRHSIFYIAHLSDSERMFFVTLLLNSLITWMRKQSGTTSLRSLLYFDEIFGYFPPTAEPPSKKPLLTILKQARAFGVGAVLVTQNPVDIDYKGLSNAGTWFIGKLQTERDKMRVLDGLEGAIAEAGGKGGKDFSKIISSLSSRVFLLHNVHADNPVIYHTRWAMSYLRGPLTRPQVKKLMKAKKAKPASDNDIPFEIVNAENPKRATKKTKKLEVEMRPSADPSIEQKYFIVRKTEKTAQRALEVDSKLHLSYQPYLLSSGKVRYYNQKRFVDVVEELAYLSGPPDSFGRSNWDEGMQIDNWAHSLLDEPDYPDNVSVSFDDIPASANTKKEFDMVKKAFSDWLYKSKSIQTLQHEKLEMFQEGEESEESFRMRIQQKAREFRDEELDEIKDRYEPKFDSLSNKIRKEEEDVEEAKDEMRDRRNAEMINVAETIFSVFVKGRSRSLSTAATKRRMKRKASNQYEAAQADLEELSIRYEDLEEELEEKLHDARERWDRVTDGIISYEIKPRRSDVVLDKVILCWMPFWVADSGKKTSALY